MMRFMIFVRGMLSIPAVAAISSLSIPAVVKGFDASHVIVEYQEKRVTVPKKSVKSGMLKEGQAVLITLEVDQIIKFVEDYQKN